jgi:hypothetical protein
MGLAQPAGNIDIFRADREAPSVMEAVRAYDPSLVVGWDSASCRWSLLRISQGGWHVIGVYAGPDGQYLPLDRRVLDYLHQADMWKKGETPDQAAARLEQEDDARRQKVEDDFDDDISHLTRSNRRQLYNALDKERI